MWNWKNKKKKQTCTSVSLSLTCCNSAVRWASLSVKLWPTFSTISFDAQFDISFVKLENFSVKRSWIAEDNSSLLNDGDDEREMTWLGFEPPTRICMTDCCKKNIWIKKILFRQFIQINVILFWGISCLELKCVADILNYNLSQNYIEQLKYTISHNL